VLALLVAVDPAVPHIVVADHAANAAGVLTGIAAICSAIVWPVLIGLILWWFREPAKELLQAAVGVAEGATRFKIWQIEFDRDVQQAVSQSESAALGAPVLPPAAASRIAAPSAEAAETISTTQVAAATRVRSLLDAAPNSTLRESAEAAIKARMLGFAQEYETTRASMHSGPDRTRAMNGVVAKMRTLALAADFLLDDFMNAAASPGRRLAAICILQLKPEMRTVPWLVDRMRLEQPFVFFHASVALLNAVRRFGAAERKTLDTALQTARTQIQNFGEHADANTIRSLTLALSELDAPA
jgi:hypothetical protein